MNLKLVSFICSSVLAHVQEQLWIQFNLGFLDLAHMQSGDGGQDTGCGGLLTPSAKDSSSRALTATVGPLIALQPSPKPSRHLCLLPVCVGK